MTNLFALSEVGKYGDVKSPSSDRTMKRVRRRIKQVMTNGGVVKRRKSKGKRTAM